MYYIPAVNVYVRPGHSRKSPRLAGMLRGLAVSYDGYAAISGLTNRRFATARRIRFQFSTVKKAFAFKRTADATMGRFIEVRRIRIP